MNKNREKNGFEEEAKRNGVLAEANILISPMHSLIGSSPNTKTILDKYFAQFPKDSFDTVIVDDANLIDQVDLIQGALKYGCRRLVMFGNKQLVPSHFSL